MSDIEDLIKVKRAEIQAELESWSASLPLSASESVTIRFSLEVEVGTRVRVSNATGSTVRKRNERTLLELLDIRCLTDTGISHPDAMRIRNILMDDFEHSSVAWGWDNGWETARVNNFLQKTDSKKMLRIPNFGKKMLSNLNTVLSYYGYPTIL